MNEQDTKQLGTDWEGKGIKKKQPPDSFLPDDREGERQKGQIDGRTTYQYIACPITGLNC